MPTMSVMDHPDLAPKFAKVKPRFAAGQTWRKAAMFLQEDVEVYSEIVGGMRTIKSWRPGLRYVQISPDDHEADETFRPLFRKILMSAPAPISPNRRTTARLLLAFMAPRGMPPPVPLINASLILKLTSFGTSRPR